MERGAGTTKDTNQTKMLSVTSNGGFDAILFNVVDFAKNPVRQGRQTLSDFFRNIAIKDL
jgi:hypothetical protein